MQTQPTSASVPDFLAAVPDERRRADARQICALLTEVTGEPAVMWGDSMSIRERYVSNRTNNRIYNSLTYCSW